MWPFSDMLRKVPQDQLAKDIHEACELARATFSDPPSERDITALMERGGCVMIDKRKGHVIGFATAAPIRRGLRVLSIAVSEQQRRKKKATWMIRGLQQQLEFGERLIAYVSDHNTVAQMFFRSLKFRAVKVKRRYFDNGDDAYIFRWDK